MNGRHDLGLVLRFGPEPRHGIRMFDPDGPRRLKELRDRKITLEACPSRCRSGRRSTGFARPVHFIIRGITMVGRSRPVQGALRSCWLTGLSAVRFPTPVRFASRSPGFIPFSIVILHLVPIEPRASRSRRVPAI